MEYINSKEFWWGYAIAFLLDHGFSFEESELKADWAVRESTNWQEMVVLVEALVKERAKTK